MGEQNPSALPPPPSSPPIPPYLCPPLQTGQMQHIFHPTVCLCLSGHTFNLKSPLSSHTNEVTDSLTDACYCVLESICVCVLCIVYILCILDYKSKYLCEIVGGVSYWQITTGSAIMCLLDTLSNRQKIGLNICLLLRSFWCMNIDPAALIASDSDNKNRLSEKTFLKTSSWICTEKSEEWAQWKKKLSFSLKLFVNFLELWG